MCFYGYITNVVCFFKRFLEDLKQMLGRPVPVVYKYLWQYVCPVAMLGLLGASLLKMFLQRPTYTAWNKAKVNSHLTSSLESCTSDAEWNISVAGVWGTPPVSEMGACCPGPPHCCCITSCAYWIPTCRYSGTARPVPFRCRGRVRALCHHRHGPPPARCQLSVSSSKRSCGMYGIERVIKREQS